MRFECAVLALTFESFVDYVIYLLRFAGPGDVRKVEFVFRKL